MSVEVRVQVLKDTATPALAAKIAQCDPHRLATRLAPPLARHWRDHLVKLPRNKHGYPSTGFWEDAARRVTGIAQGGSVLLSSDKLGLRKRLYGGPVTAVNVPNLTIPICAEAYGTTVKDWGDNLTLVILADGRKFLALWLGSEERQRQYASKLGSAMAQFEQRRKAGKIQSTAHERMTKAIQASFGSESTSHPKVIVFKQASGSTVGRAERHMDLKFLFRLMPKTGDQAPMPQVIPPDLSERTMELLQEAVK